jgi:hypothetical protein
MISVLWGSGVMLGEMLELAVSGKSMSNSGNSWWSFSGASAEPSGLRATGSRDLWHRCPYRAPVSGDGVVATIVIAQACSQVVAMSRVGCWARWVSAMRFVLAAGRGGGGNRFTDQPSPVFAVSVSLVAVGMAVTSVINRRSAGEVRTVELQEDRWIEPGQDSR